MGEPANRAHCHVLIDDKEAPRSEKELTALFTKACKLWGLERGTWKTKNRLMWYLVPGRHKKSETLKNVQIVRQKPRLRKKHGTQNVGPYHKSWQFLILRGQTKKAIRV